MGGREKLGKLTVFKKRQIPSSAFKLPLQAKAPNFHVASPFLSMAKFDWLLLQGGGHFIGFIQERKIENSKTNLRLTFPF